MKIDVFSKDPHDLYTTPLLQQTAYWSEVKSRLGFVPMAFEIEVNYRHPKGCQFPGFVENCFQHY